jgi:hypothetical protein
MELFMRILNEGIKWNCYGEMCIVSSCLNSRVTDFVQMALLILSVHFGFLLRNTIKSRNCNQLTPLERLPTGTFSGLHNAINGLL